MTGLRKLEYEFHADPAPAKVGPDQVFLSKLTIILAFKKMTRNGVDIQSVLKDPRAASRNVSALCLYNYCSFGVGCNSLVFSFKV